MATKGKGNNATPEVTPQAATPETQAPTDTVTQTPADAVTETPQEGVQDPVANVQDSQSAAAEEKGKAHIVANEFRDIADFSKVYKVGDDVSHFAAERLKGLVEKGLVEQR
jgi:hypothetical protein